jgi:hypothetical protein
MFTSLTTYEFAMSRHTATAAEAGQARLGRRARRSRVPKRGRVVELAGRRLLRGQPVHA